LEGYWPTKQLIHFRSHLKSFFVQSYFAFKLLFPKVKFIEEFMFVHEMRVNIFAVHKSLLSNLSFLVDLVLKYHCMKWQLKEKKAYLSTLQKN
jgi:hypothetical protein